MVHVRRWATRCMRSQVIDGLRSAAEAIDAGPCAATVAITTLEGHAVVLRLDSRGVRIESAADDCPYSRQTYDCVNSLLLNQSSGFRAYFNASLAAALAVAANGTHTEALEEQALEEEALEKDGAIVRS
jgi:hypothetical protein